MYAKIEEGRLVLLPKIYTYDGRTYSNYDKLDDETLLSHGWKPLVDTPKPEPRDGIVYMPSYINDGDNIAVEWTAVETEPESAPEPQMSPMDYITDIYAILSESGTVAAERVPELIKTDVSFRVSAIVAENQSLTNLKSR